MPEITLPQGTIHYRDEGAGPPLVFVHGALVNGRLWEPVVERLAGDVRCIVPDLPLGSHTRSASSSSAAIPSGWHGSRSPTATRSRTSRRRRSTAS